MSHASSSTSRTGCCGGSSGRTVRGGNATGASSTKGGCSCGGSCGCGGGACHSQDFVRPRFFAGQLLTEDDLDLLATYVVEKNRLHNRSFFGEGVVCGLMVTCSPCGGGTVTVQPGHALDCCGNDLVVTCPETVDINALVKRLRMERNAGIDCGDPCADAKARPASDTKPSSGATNAAGQPSTETPVPPLAPAEFCLYIRYCEESTDPVSPYATDDPCGVQACEPTRIQEGFTFELRCRTCEEEVPDNLFTQIGNCLGNLVTTEQTTRSARSAFLYNAALAPALIRLDSPEPAKAFITAERISASNEASERVKALPDAADKWTALDLYEAADAAQTMASLVAAWTDVSATDRRAVENGDTIKAAVKNAQGSLARLQKIAPRDTVATLITDPLDREVVTATAERALLWANPDQAVKATPAAERELMRAGVVYSAKTRSSLATALARVKANLIDRLMQRTAVTDCTLLRDLQAIVIPDDDSSLSTNRASARQAQIAIEQTMDVLIRYLRECICSAINPPCPPCDDPAVLLACLRVEGCEVRDICNLERTFVLTPVAIRYWMPFLRAFGNLLERVCCPSNRCDPPSRGPRERLLVTPEPAVEPLSRAYVERRSALRLADNFVGVGKTLDPEHLAAILPAPLSFSADSARRLAFSTAAMVDLVSLRQGLPPGDLLSMLFKPPTRVSDTGRPQPSLPDPAVDAGVLRKDLDDLRTKLGAAEERNRKIDERLKKLEEPHA